LEANKKQNIIYYTPAIGWGILIIYFSLLPSQKVPSLLKNIWDFSLHTGIYFLLAALIFLGYTQFKKTAFNLSTAFFTILLVAVLGGALELIQEYYITNRSGEWLDFVANNFGAVIASGAWFFLVKK